MRSSITCVKRSLTKAMATYPIHSSKAAKIPVTQPPEEIRFTTNVVDLLKGLQPLLSYLHSMGYKVLAPGLISLGIGYMTAADPHAAITSFIQSSSKYWDKIKNRDEAFFMENGGSLFTNIPVDEENINVLASMFGLRDSHGRMIIDDAIKDDVWSVFHSLVKICIKYLHLHRGPYMNGDKGAYGEVFMDDVVDNRALALMADSWSVMMPFPRLAQ